jgi:hypothetical protein
METGEKEGKVRKGRDKSTSSALHCWTLYQGTVRELLNTTGVGQTGLTGALCLRQIFAFQSFWSRFYSRLVVTNLTCHRKAGERDSKLC